MHSEVGASHEQETWRHGAGSMSCGWSLRSASRALGLSEPSLTVIVEVTGGGDSVISVKSKSKTRGHNFPLLWSGVTLFLP